MKWDDAIERIFTMLETYGGYMAGGSDYCISRTGNIILLSFDDDSIFEVIVKPFEPVSNPCRLIDWQPPETAPRDGKAFWAWVQDKGIRKMQWDGDDRFECLDHIGAWTILPGWKWEPDWKWAPLEAINEPTFD